MQIDSFMTAVNRRDYLSISSVSKDSQFCTYHELRQI